MTLSQLSLAQLSLANTRGAGGGIAALAAQGVLTAWWDFSDLTSLKKKSDGTTGNVSADGDLLGLAFDKAQMDGKTSGSFIDDLPNLVTNGTFDTDVTGWSGIRSATPSYDAGSMKVTTGAQSYGGAGQDVSSGFSAGDTLILSADAIADAAVGARAFIGNSDSSAAYSGVATVAAGQSATLSAVLASMSSAAAANATMTVGHNTASATAGYEALFDNISVKSVPGIPIIQATAGQQPEYDFTDNIHSLIFDGSDDTIGRASASLPSDCSIFFAVKMVGDGEILFAENSNAGGADAYIGYYKNNDVAGALAGSSGSPSVLIDEIEVAHPDGLHDAITDGAWHVGEIRNADLSGWAGFYLSGYGTTYRTQGSFGKSVAIIATANLTESRRQQALGDLRRGVGI